MIVMPGLALEDLRKADLLPNIRQLAEMGALGLMNSRMAIPPAAAAYERETGALRPWLEGCYVTLGAGVRAAGDPAAREAYMRGEIVEGVPAEALYQRRTLSSPGRAEVIFVEGPYLAAENASFNVDITPGLLGAMLHQAGLKTAVVGNSDSQSVHREIATTAMDDRGLVDYGEVGASLNSRDPLSAEGVAANIPRLTKAALRCIELADFTAVEFGDLARLERVSGEMTPTALENERAKVLRAADRVLGNILAGVDLKNTRVLVVAPYPPYAVARDIGNNLTPMILVGGDTKRGTLSSGSTRNPGVVTNADVAPSVLHWLGVAIPPKMVGRPILSSADSNPYQTIVRTNNRVSAQVMRLPMLRTSGVVIIVLVSFLTALWLILPPEHPARRRWFAFLALLPASFAPSIVLLTAVRTDSITAAWFVLAGMVVGISGISLALFRRGTSALMAVSLAFSAAIILDLILGGYLARFSAMGYSLSEGSRYYGIGNELSGSLLGAMLVGAALLLGGLRASERAIRLVMALVFVMMVIVVGGPRFGADAGGAISATAAFGAVIVMTLKPGTRLRAAVGVTAGVFGVLAALVLLDLYLGKGRQSHVGEAVSLAQSSGLAEIGVIIKRKLAMNLLLIRSSVWARLLAAYGITLAILLSTSRAFPRMSELPIHLQAGIVGVAVGTLAAFAFNDSGVVAAATCFVFGWSLIVLRMLES